MFYTIHSLMFNKINTLKKLRMVFFRRVLPLKGPLTPSSPTQAQNFYYGLMIETGYKFHGKMADYRKDVFNRSSTDCFFCYLHFSSLVIQSTRSLFYNYIIDFRIHG